MDPLSSGLRDNRPVDPSAEMILNEYECFLLNQEIMKQQGPSTITDCYSFMSSCLESCPGENIVTRSKKFYRPQQNFIVHIRVRWQYYDSASCILVLRWHILKNKSSETYKSIHERIFIDISQKSIVIYFKMCKGYFPLSLYFTDNMLNLSIISTN